MGRLTGHATAASAPAGAPSGRAGQRRARPLEHQPGTPARRASSANERTTTSAAPAAAPAGA